MALGNRGIHSPSRIHAGGQLEYVWPSKPEQESSILFARSIQLCMKGPVKKPHRGQRPCTVEWKEHKQRRKHVCGDFVSKHAPLRSLGHGVHVVVGSLPLKVTVIPDTR